MNNNKSITNCNSPRGLPSLFSSETQFSAVSPNATELPLSKISALFHVPLHQAASILKVDHHSLKKRCRELGIKRWPYRKCKHSVHPPVQGNLFSSFRIQKSRQNRYNMFGSVFQQMCSPNALLNSFVVAAPPSSISRSVIFDVEGNSPATSSIPTSFVVAREPRHEQAPYNDHYNMPPPTEQFQVIPSTSSSPADSSIAPSGYLAQHSLPSFNEFLASVETLQNNA